MEEIIKNNLFSFFKYCVFSPVLGWVTMLVLYQLLDALEIDYRKGNKLKCWLALTFLVFIFSFIVKSFSCS